MKIQMLFLVAAIVLTAHIAEGAKKVKATRPPKKQLAAPPPGSSSSESNEPEDYVMKPDVMPREDSSESVIYPPSQSQLRCPSGKVQCSCGASNDVLRKTKDNKNKPKGRFSFGFGAGASAGIGLGFGK